MTAMHRRSLFPPVAQVIVFVWFAGGLCCADAVQAESADQNNSARPNILFAIADDWGWPHAGAYGDPVVKTPTFDRLAREGVLFHHAYVSSPSCTPSRGAILTGQWHWRLEGAGNLWSVLPDKFTTYPELRETAGYFTGSSGKAWGPGRTATKGRNPAGKRFKNFHAFLSIHGKAVVTGGRDLGGAHVQDSRSDFKALSNLFDGREVHRITGNVQRTVFLPVPL